MASSLNSNDVFVLCASKTGFLWYGKGCSGDERELAKEVAGMLAPKFKDDFTIIMEGKEPDAFWDILGGKAEYASGGRLVVIEIFWHYVSFSIKFLSLLFILNLYQYVPPSSFHRSQSSRE